MSVNAYLSNIKKPRNLLHDPELAMIDGRVFSDRELLLVAKAIESKLFPKKEKTLDESSFIIIKGLLEGKTYEAIAEESYYAYGYVGEKSRTIFRLLSKYLGEKVSKVNFRWIVQSRLL